MTEEQQVWLRLTTAVEEAEKASGDSRISDELSEFRIVRREDSQVVEKRKSLAMRQKSAKQLDEEFSEIGPERLRLSKKEIALESIKSVAQTISEIPTMLDRTRKKLSDVSKYSSEPNIIWRDESGAFETQELLQSLQALLNSELGALAQEVLDIVADGEKNGWQV